MAKTKKPANPFYVILVIVGVVFVITACAYAVMAVKGVNPVPASERPPEPLMDFMAEHGFTMLMVELAILALATVGAIGSDEWRTRNAQAAAAAAENDSSKPGVDS